MKRTIQIIIFAILSSDARTQAFDSALSILNDKFPQEKIYMQFDRSVYAPGETIFTKAWLFSGNDLSHISKTVYADIFDEQGKMLSHQIAPNLDYGSAFSFELPVKLEGSNVLIRAYTKWMLNFDTAFIYEKLIPLSNFKFSEKGFSSSQVIKFFPEGGDLIENLESRVAFKSTDENGYPINIAGDIINSKGEKVTMFKPSHDGMGFFDLRPGIDEKYTCLWKDLSGNIQKQDLPPVKKNGLVLSVEHLEKDIRFSISSSNNAEYKPESVFVVAQTQQQLFYKAKANFKTSSKVKGLIPISTLPAGIVQITIFSDKSEPLAERIIFVNPDNYYFTPTITSSIHQEKRKKSFLEIEVHDTIRTNMSISVTDAELNPKQTGEENIYSHVLLSSDIKGYIHNPSYYFSNADSAALHMDLIMMTNGWRRFSWKKILSNQWPEIKNTPESYLNITGKISGLTEAEMQGRSISGVIELKNGNRDFLNIPFDKKGNVSSEPLLFYDTAKLYYQLNNDKNKRLTAKVNFALKNDFLKGETFNRKNYSADFSGINRALPFQKNKVIAEQSAIQLDSFKTKTLATILISGKQKSREEKMEDLYASGLFTGGDAQTFILEDDINAASSLSVFNYLQGKVAGLQINRSESGGYTLNWRGGTPGLYMNELSTEAETLETIPMGDVAMIKVFRPPFLGGFSSSGGAIAVYLKKGVSANQNAKGLDYVKIPGYTLVREFYSPDYSRATDQNTAADLRKTLYWNPYITTAKDKRKVVISFYNNDITKKIRVVIEGINFEGKLTHVEKLYE